MKRGRWRKAEIDELKLLLEMGVTPRNAAARLNRSFYGVRGQMRLMREDGTLERFRTPAEAGFKYGIVISKEHHARIMELTKHLSGNTTFSRRLDYLFTTIFGGL